MRHRNLKWWSQFVLWRFIFAWLVLFNRRIAITLEEWNRYAKFERLSHDIRDQLSVRYPRRSIAVGEVSWFHGSPFTADSYYTECTISIQPGFDGYLNQNFSGNSLQEALDKFNQAAPE